MVSFSWPNQSDGVAAGHPSDDRSPGKYSHGEHSSGVAGANLNPTQAEEILQGLAEVFSQHQNPAVARHVVYPPERPDQGWSKDEDAPLPNLEARYRALVEQIPAVVFMAYLDRGNGEAYVSPQIEAALGFSQEEWLEDPIRWYSHIHPEDKDRWSTEAAEMFLTGNPLRSAYRVISRDGRVIWFHCEAKMIRKENGEPWFIHGVGFDITDLKQTEKALQDERNVVSAILDTVGALVVVLNPEGRIMRFNRACELMTGYSFAEVHGKFVWDLFLVPEEVEAFKDSFHKTRADEGSHEYESSWVRRDGKQRIIAWSATALPASSEAASYVIASGIDITERKHLEKTILEVSAREQRRIGQDLHDGLGQHLTGIAFMSKVQEQKLMEKGLCEAGDATKIVKLVNEAIHKTRELARGLLPVVSDAQGLMSALKQWAGEVEDLFAVSCQFRCLTPVLIHDDTVATHLYHIAREAVNNAIKHGHPSHIFIRLAADQHQGTLSIEDDGCGIGAIARDNKGMGLHLMSYRARIVGGSLDVKSVATGGTIVTCLFPVDRDRVKGA
ncbi:MAG: domain S-box protein [Candidatus Sulfotelmatobacter sp.]|nr:domain S-box protein [Candidatus Sulfotelmatobacter sp.]